MSAHSERQFIDTNIVIYAHDISAGSKHKRAKKLVTCLWDDGNGCLSIQVLQEFYVIVTQKIARPIPDESASAIISALSRWTVHVPDVDDILEAVRIRHRYQLSFWDAMILCSAERLSCSILWTEDLNHNQMYDRIKVLNPFL